MHSWCLPGLDFPLRAHCKSVLNRVGSGLEHFLLMTILSLKKKKDWALAFVAKVFEKVQRAGCIAVQALAPCTLLAPSPRLRHCLWPGARHFLTAAAHSSVFILFDFPLEFDIDRGRLLKAVPSWAPRCSFSFPGCSLSLSFRGAPPLATWSLWEHFNFLSVFCIFADVRITFASSQCI